jgi:lysophospholipase L1-like esterase
MRKKPIKSKAPMVRAFSILALLMSGTQAHSQETRYQGPLMMGVMGDSISAATLADFPIPSDPSSSGDKVQLDELQEKMIFENKFLLSWASGVGIKSHYVRLKDYFKRKGETRPIQVDNVSYPGRLTNAMEDQALQLLQDFREGGYSELKYVTLLVGSNDACSSQTPWGVPLGEMHDNLIKAFRILSMFPQKEPVHVLVVGIPRIPDLAERSLRESKTILGLSCNTVRNKILKECNPLLTWKTEKEYDQKMMIIENDNRLIRDTVTEVNKLFPKIQAVYSDRLYNLNIPRSILAADCFHPNADGQQQLADQVWMDQPWFD